MKVRVCLLLWLAVLVAQAQPILFTWSNSPSPGVIGYTIHHGTNSGNYFEFATVGASSPADTDFHLGYGPNYFNITALVFMQSIMETPLTNEIVVTNLDVMSLTTLTEKTVDISSGWCPLFTNRIIFPNSGTAFFRARLALVHTNKIILPTP